MRSGSHQQLISETWRQIRGLQPGTLEDLELMLRRENRRADGIYPDSWLAGHVAFESEAELMERGIAFSAPQGIALPSSVPGSFKGKLVLAGGRSYIGGTEGNIVGFDGETIPATPQDGPGHQISRGTILDPATEGMISRLEIDGILSAGKIYLTEAAMKSLLALIPSGI